MTSATLDTPAVQETATNEFDSLNADGIYQPKDFAAQLRAETIGVRVNCRKFFARKSLNRDQVKTAADQFKADSKMMSAAKRLLDTSFEPYRAVTSIIQRARQFWLSLSVDYPVHGIRLIRKSLVKTFDDEMQSVKSELAEATAKLEEHYTAMVEEAKTRLGDLFNPADYPERLGMQFDLEWDFPSVEPPQELQKLNPALYEQERSRIAARFETALAMAEEAFTEELHELVGHLAERLTDPVDGSKPKVLKGAAVFNIRDFFERFKTLSVKSNPELDKLVENAAKVLDGVKPSDLRDNAETRTTIRQKMQEITATLDSMMVSKPRQISLDD